MLNLHLHLTMLFINSHMLFTNSHMLFTNSLMLLQLFINNNINLFRNYLLNITIPLVNTITQLQQLLLLQVTQGKKFGKLITAWQH
jgi:hypothetical protein